MEILFKDQSRQLATSMSDSAAVIEKDVSTSVEAEFDIFDIWPDLLSAICREFNGLQLCTDLEEGVPYCNGGKRICSGFLRLTITTSAG